MGKRSGLCILCGGEMKNDIVDLELWVDGTLRIIKDIPARVCLQCGEEAISAEVAKQIDELLDSEVEPFTYVSVPVYRIPIPQQE